MLSESGGGAAGSSVLRLKRSSNKKKEKDVVQRGFLSESGVGLHRAARLRSGASRVKDESPPPNRTDADVIDRGIAGLRHDVAFADRLLCVRSGS